MLKLYNTLSRKKEIFKPFKGKRAGLYTCGPTVYWPAHIGNLRSYIFSDLLKRTLDYNNYRVKYVMNFTDVDDKTIKRTIKEYGKNANKDDLKKYTEKYIKVFKNDIKKLNIEEPLFIRATGMVEEIKRAVKKLIKKDFAYIKNGSTYFNIKSYNQKYKDYAKLSGENFLKGLKLGTVISVDEYKKENIGDFALWKKFDKKRDGNIFWSDPILGKGRPGWHIECSVISMKYLGKQFDIHTGGVDLIFPHHSNEIAQSQAISNKTPFVKYWLHPEHLIVEGEKMAKSKGNFYILNDIEKKFNPLAFRYLCLTSNYRSKLNFTWDSLKSSQNALNKLYEKISEFKKEGAGKKLSPKAKTYKNKFLKFINDDLNVGRALALTWKMIESKNISNKEKYKLLLNFDKIFGLDFKEVRKEKIPKDILNLVKERERYRAQKNWQKADEVRKKIKKIGYQIEDTKKGPKLKPL